MKNVALLIILIPLICLAEEEHIKGTVYFGPEAMYFQACGSAERWWLGARSFQAKGWKNVEMELNKQPQCDLPAMPCEHQSTIISGLGSVSEKGEYGHMGQYLRQIQFTEITVELETGVCEI